MLESFFPNGAKYRIVVAIPCMGTGVGKMTGIESAQQVSEAIADVCTGSETEIDIWTDANNQRPKHAYVLTEMACPQRDCRADGGENKLFIIESKSACSKRVQADSSDGDDIAHPS